MDSYFISSTLIYTPYNLPLCFSQRVRSIKAKRQKFPLCKWDQIKDAIYQMVKSSILPILGGGGCCNMKYTTLTNKEGLF